MVGVMLRLEGLTKSYSGAFVNRNISFSLGKSEVHALLGENGAGKSTLVKIVYGLIKPDSGRMILNGLDFNPNSPCDARSSGIGMIFQHFSLFDEWLGMHNYVCM